MTELEMSLLDQYLELADPCTLQDLKLILKDYDKQIEKEIQQYKQLYKDFKQNKLELVDQLPITPQPEPERRSLLKLELPPNYSQLDLYKYKLLMNETAPVMPISFNITNKYFMLDAMDRQAPLHMYIKNKQIPLESQIQFSCSLSELPRLQVIQHLVKLNDISQITGIFYKALQIENAQESVNELNLPYIIEFEIVACIIQQSHALLKTTINVHNSLMDLVQLDHYFESLNFIDFYKKRTFLATFEKMDLICKTLDVSNKLSDEPSSILSYFHSNIPQFIMIDQVCVSKLNEHLKSNDLEAAKELVIRCLFIYSHISTILQKSYISILIEMANLLSLSAEVPFLFEICQLFKQYGFNEINIKLHEALIFNINKLVESTLNPPKTSKLFIFAKQQDWTAHTPDQISRMHSVLSSCSKELKTVYARQFEEALESIWINRIYDSLRRGQIHCFVNSNDKQLIKTHCELMRGFLNEYLQDSVLELTILHLKIIEKAFKEEKYNYDDFPKGLPRSDMQQLVQLVIDLK
eukprot:NODE_93_length_21581_cov_0.291919.p3 type:complete len:524 gc:universal NODE_93_length_21581_cov_0.291919:18724-20295(+)